MSDGVPSPWPAILGALLASCALPPARPPADDGWLVERGEPRAAPAPPPVGPAPFEQCGTTDEGFEGWMASFGAYARAQGISAGAVAVALAAAVYDPGVVELDRSQRPFKLSFAEFAARRITADRVARGKRALARDRDLLRTIVERFGVQPEILVAVWGLETDYGDNLGATPALRALATLAYDCRRATRFRGELLSALRILDRGDLTEDEMVGAWAGELGQTQFLPSSYERFGVDFDGDGRVDMVQSRADALASTASYLAAHGWRPRETYQAGSRNFDVLGEWNASEIYRKTIVLFATRLAMR